MVDSSQKQIGKFSFYFLMGRAQMATCFLRIRWNDSNTVLNIFFHFYFDFNYVYILSLNAQFVNSSLLMVTTYQQASLTLSYIGTKCFFHGFCIFANILLKGRYF